MVSPSPIDEDYERIAETLYNLDVMGRIQDEESFKQAYNEYFEDNPEWLKDKKKYNNVLEDFQQIKQIPHKNLFKEAGGKNLVMDRKKTSSQKVKTQEEYLKKGATNVDLVGYDDHSIHKQNLYTYPAYEKSGRIVYARREYIFIKGHRIEKYRDKRGRFVSRKARK